MVLALDFRSATWVQFPVATCESVVTSLRASITISTLHQKIQITCGHVGSFIKSKCTTLEVLIIDTFYDSKPIVCLYFVFFGFGIGHPVVKIAYQVPSIICDRWLIFG